MSPGLTSGIESAVRADLALIDRILSPANEPEVTPAERFAFRDMRRGLVGVGAWPLSAAQRSWAEQVDARLKPIDVSKVPPLSGRVPTMPVLAAPLPKKPPGRT